MKNDRGIILNYSKACKMDIKTLNIKIPALHIPHFYFNCFRLFCHNKRKFLQLGFRQARMVVIGKAKAFLWQQPAKIHLPVVVFIV